MINCDGICMVFGIQWWIVYITIGVVVGFVFAVVAVEDYGDQAISGLGWFLATLLWPAMILIMIVYALSFCLGALVSFVRDKLP